MARRHKSGNKGLPPAYSMYGGTQRNSRTLRSEDTGSSAEHKSEMHPIGTILRFPEGQHTVVGRGYHGHYHLLNEKGEHSFPSKTYVHEHSTVIAKINR